MTLGYHVFDSRTGHSVATAKSLKSAHRKADRLDAEYGAVRYTVRFIDQAYLDQLWNAQQAWHMAEPINPLPCEYCDSIEAMTGTRNCPIHACA